MHPLTLCEALSPVLTGRILQDVTEKPRNGRRLGRLAAVTGRRVDGVRWVTCNGDGDGGRVLLLLESPEVCDEPAGLFIPADPVQAVKSQGVTGGAGARCHVLALGDGGELRLTTTPLSGREFYEPARSLTPEQARLFLDAQTAHGGRLPVKAVAEGLGMNPRRAQDLAASWDRAGWITKGRGRGFARQVTAEGLAEAERVLSWGSAHA